MPTFGITTSGGNTFPGTNDRAILSKFTAPASGTVTQINQLFDASSTAGANFKGLIYAANGSGGIPGTRLGVGSAVAVPAGGGDLASTGLSVSIVGGVDYWIGSVIDSFQPVWSSDAGGAGLSRMEAATYAAPAATWTQSGTGGATVNVYATYVSGPTITAQPLSQRLSAGQSPVFTVAATGTGSLSYQWYSNASGSFVAVGSNSATYSPGALAAGDRYDVYCDVTDTVATTRTMYASAWAPVSKQGAWANLYGRGGQRHLVRGFGLIPNSKDGAAAMFSALAGPASAAPGISLTVTEQLDVGAATAGAALQAAAAQTEIADGLAATLAAALTASLSATEAGDTLAATVSGATTLIATLAITEAGDSSSGAAAAALVATASFTEAAEVAAATAAAAMVAAGSASESADALAGVAAGGLQAQLAATEQGDTLSATSGVAAPVASLTVTEGADTLSAAGTVALVVTGANLEQGDALSAAGQVALQAALALTEAVDGLSSSASLGAGAPVISASITEQADGAGSQAAAALQCASSTADQADVVGAVASVGLSATASLSEQIDALSAQAARVLFAVASPIEVGDALVSAAQLGAPPVAGVRATRMPGGLSRAGPPALSRSGGATLRRK